MMRYGLFRYGMMGGGILAHIAGALFTLVIVALVVLLIVSILRHGRHAGMHAHMAPPAQASAPAESENSALRILDERFAKGEIGEEEYTKKKELLSKK